MITAVRLLLVSTSSADINLRTCSLMQCESESVGSWQARGDVGASRLMLCSLLWYSLELSVSSVKALELGDLHVERVVG